jgi:hypothetical protein
MDSQDAVQLNNLIEGLKSQVQMENAALENTQWSSGRGLGTVRTFR